MKKNLCVIGIVGIFLLSASGSLLVSAEEDSASKIKQSSSENVTSTNPSSLIIAPDEYQTTTSTEKLIEELNSAEKTSESIENVPTAESSTPILDLKIFDLTYDISKKTISGKTSPDASVFVSLPNNLGQVTVAADVNGLFSVTDNFGTGMLVSLTAVVNGESSPTISYVIPTNPLLKISDISYDPVTQVLSGKTEPNTGITLGIVIQNGGEVLLTSDANGNFYYKEAFQEGTVIRITAWKDQHASEPVLFTIPESAISSSIASSTNESSSIPKATTKKLLPKTGEDRKHYLSALGLTTLVSCFIYFKKNS